MDGMIMILFLWPLSVFVGRFLGRPTPSFLELPILGRGAYDWGSDPESAEAFPAGISPGPSGNVYIVASGRT